MILTGIDMPFSINQLLKDIKRGVLIALKNIGLQVIIIVFVLVIAVFLPFLSPFVPFVLFFVGAYFQGFSMIDYRNEYHRLTVAESREFINSHKGLVIGNGAVFQIFLLIPIIGTIFAPVFSIVAAALAIEKLDEKHK